jgi:hypothetical protein
VANRPSSLVRRPNPRPPLHHLQIAASHDCPNFFSASSATPCPPPWLIAPGIEDPAVVTSAPCARGEEPGGGAWSTCASSVLAGVAGAAAPLPSSTPPSRPSSWMTVGVLYRQQ